MKIPTARKLPSGNWFIQLRMDGRSISITEDAEDKAIAAAMAIKSGLVSERRDPESITLETAYSRYIESKDAVLSPRTVSGYRQLQRNYLQELMPLQLRSITPQLVQKSINAMSRKMSPKTVANANGLLVSVLAMFCPDLRLNTALPQKRRVEISVPDEAQITAMIQAVRGSEIELPVLLAVWLGLRMSEIRGITWGCISGNVLHIKQAIVDVDGVPTLKTTKTYSGDRKLKIPPQILSLIQARPRDTDYVVTLSAQAITKRFWKMLERNNLPHIRFHDLRHANASVMLALGVPNRYAQERMGHATDNMLKTVYQHIMSEKQNDVDQAVDNFFANKIANDIL